MKKVEIKKAFGFGWDSIKKDFWYFVGLSAIFMVLPGVVSDQQKYQSLSFLGSLLTIWLTAGFLRICLEYCRGKKLPFETIFTEIKYFWRILGAQILIGLIVLGGLILLIVPGIYWALKYQFVINAIIDKDCGIREAMGISGELTKGIKLRLLLLNLAAFGIIILGALVLGVGVLVAIPIIYLADMYIYKKLSE